MTGADRVDDSHPFGGPWTEVKLDALNSYSSFYTTALKSQSFDLWYIDAFAGTGVRTAKQVEGGLLDGKPQVTVEVTLDGSATRALAVQPPFSHLVFIEERKKHYDALCDLVSRHPARDARAIRGDANTILPSVLSERAWTGSETSRMQRGIVFLDPYGINVDWGTLQLLAANQRVDVWYLVNLKGVYQQLARNHERLDNTKRRSLDRFFGTVGWEEEFYNFNPPVEDLLGFIAQPIGSRVVTKERVGKFYQSRLSGLFRYVSEPLGLKVRSLDDYFQLYCLSNNPSEKALKLIRRGAEAVIRKHSPAFHRRSDH